MPLGPFSHLGIPSASPQQDPSAPIRWYIFRIREQMYGMGFNATCGFWLMAIPEDREADFDGWCIEDPRFTYVRLSPHPMDDELAYLTRRTAHRELGIPNTDTDNDRYEREFLSKYAPTVLEAVKRFAL